MERHHTNKKQVLDRLSRAIGHLEAVRRMVEDDRDCAEVLTQITAVRTAVGSVGRILLLDHIGDCVADAVENGDPHALDTLETAVSRFVK